MIAINRGQKSVAVPLPAPVGGLNTTDPLAAMDIRYASVMKNLFPKTASVDTRPGFVAGETILSGGSNTNIIPGFVKYGETSLWAVASLSGTSSVIENVVTGAQENLGVSIVGHPIYAQLSNSSGTYVAAILQGSGQNYWTFDGTNWTNQTGSITNGSTYVGVEMFANRLWFWKAAGLTAYYLPTSAITGTVIEFPLGGVATKGGNIKIIATWSTDSGAGGGDDRIVFVTDAGQAIIYAGTDPAVPATFQLVGVYDIAKPISPHALKYGADLLLPLEDGLYSTAEITRGRTDSEFAISRNVRSEWQRLGKLNFGTITLKYSSKLNMLAVNFPTAAFASTGNKTSEWLVMNTITKAWTHWPDGVNAYAIDTLAGDIYFCNVTTGGGAVGTIYKMDGSATSDNGAAITWECRQAYTYCDVPTNKHCVLVQPEMRWTGNFSMTVEIDVDYEPGTISAYTSYTVASEANVRPELSSTRYGRALAVHVKGQTSAGVGSWYATNLAVIQSRTAFG